MRLKYLLTVLALLIITTVFAQLVPSIREQNNVGLIDSAKIPIPIHHFEPEYAFDNSVNPEKWLQEKPGLNVSFASTDEAYFRTEVPSLNALTDTWNETGWRGERLNAMILAWSPDSISQVRFVLHDLKTANGNVLSKKSISINMVRYVISNYPYNSKEATCGPGPVDKAYLIPDRFESFDRFDIPAKTIRPVWLSIDIPSATAPGIYKGVIEVLSEKQKTILHVEIKVQNQILPKPHNWTFQLDLWQNPWVIAEYYKVKPWSQEHKMLLKKHLKLYANAGGKFITTYAVHSPWSDDSYMKEGGMIEWNKTKNGSWKFDYNIFDQYVQLAMDAGIDKAITIYTPIPWGDRFRYTDEATGNYITERWRATSDTFKTNWNIFLTDLKTHLEKKGWLSKTYLGINENEMEQTLAAIRVVKAHSKEWRITYAGNWHPELDSLLNDYSCVFGNEPAINDLQNRHTKKQTSTFYICCTPPKPNTFVYSPPIEGRWLGWYTLAHNYDGMLRWAYDAWVADPVRDARHIYWPAGDAYMVYPGAASSIRFEKMREGISDFEKIKIIQSGVTKSSNTTAKKLMQELEQHLKTFTSEKEFDKEKLKQEVQKGRELLEQLSDY
jgi:hypothetical protein